MKEKPEAWRSAIIVLKI